MDMDRYLQRRTSLDDIEVSPPSKKKKKSKNKYGGEDKKKSFSFSRFSDALKSMLDVDEVLDLDNVNDYTPSVFELSTFRDKISQVVSRRKREGKHPENDIEITQESPDKIEEDASGDMTYMEKSAADFRRRATESSRKASEEDSVPKEEVDRVLRQSGAEPSATNHKEERQKEGQSKETRFEEDYDEGSSLKEQRDEFRDDLRKVIQISYKIMKQVPPEAIKDFKNSEDFKRYVDILDKYKLLRKKPEQ